MLLQLNSSISNLCKTTAKIGNSANYSGVWQAKTHSSVKLSRLSSEKDRGRTARFDGVTPATALEWWLAVTWLRQVKMEKLRLSSCGTHSQDQHCAHYTGIYLELCTQGEGRSPLPCLPGMFCGPSNHPEPLSQLKPNLAVAEVSKAFVTYRLFHDLQWHSRGQETY